MFESSSFCKYEWNDFYIYLSIYLPAVTALNITSTILSKYSRIFFTFPTSVFYLDFILVASLNIRKMGALLTNVGASIRGSVSMAKTYTRYLLQSFPAILKF